MENQICPGQRLEDDQPEGSYSDFADSFQDPLRQLAATRLHRGLAGVNSINHNREVTEMKRHFTPSDILWPNQQARFSVIAGSNAGLSVFGVEVNGWSPFMVIFNSNHQMITLSIAGRIFHL